MMSDNRGPKISPAEMAIIALILGIIFGLIITAFIK